MDTEVKNVTQLKITQEIKILYKICTGLVFWQVQNAYEKNQRSE